MLELKACTLENGVHWRCHLCVVVKGDNHADDLESRKNRKSELTADHLDTGACKNAWPLSAGGPNGRGRIRWLSQPQRCGKRALGCREDEGLWWGRENRNGLEHSWFSARTRTVVSAAALGDGRVAQASPFSPQWQPPQLISQAGSGEGRPGVPALIWHRPSSRSYSTHRRRCHASHLPVSQRWWGGQSLLPCPGA